MKRRLLLLAFAGVAVAVGVGVYLFSEPPTIPRGGANLEGNPQRGAYVLRLAGCVACHTNEKENGAFLAGGAPIKTGFGTFHAPNITPHLEEGIGKWSRADFFTALTEGTSPSGAHYYPAFPYGFYARMKDRDIADLWAALRQVKPAPSANGKTELVFPFSQRALLRPWRRLFFHPRAMPSPEERGAYLVEGPGHCGACHTPRNILGALKHDGALVGAYVNGERIPPITAEALRQNGWNIEDIVFALETGITPEGDVLGGSMGEVVNEATSHLTLDDLEAIATYLLTVAPELK
ncbi:MAG: cytochrome c [Hyphomicrobiales bacterium]|nr:cytochrome c [Hyphomicrobiales bacterium]